MSDNFTYDVFLSHSSKDKPVVRPLAERLRADGLRVWCGEWVLRPGDSILSKVEEGLEHSRVLVLCMSANAFGSDWAQLESYTYRFRDPLNKERRFIPLRLDAAPLKGSLAQFLYINWLTDNRERAYADLLETCYPPMKAPTNAQAAGEQITEKVIQLDYREGIRVYTFRSDGKRALTASASDNIVRLWDTETGRCLRKLKGHTNGVWSVAWSNDGHRTLSGAADHKVRRWATETGRCLRLLERHR